jgi:hypothetical protein
MLKYSKRDMKCKYCKKAYNELNAAITKESTNKALRIIGKYCPASYQIILVCDNCIIRPKIINKIHIQSC